MKRFPSLLSEAIASTKSSCLALLQRRELHMRHTMHQFQAALKADPELMRLRLSEASLSSQLADLHVKYADDTSALQRRVAEQERLCSAMRLALAHRAQPGGDQGQRLAFSH